MACAVTLQCTQDSAILFIKYFVHSPINGKKSQDLSNQSQVWEKFSELRGYA
jgi:hypothetical protein